MAKIIVKIDENGKETQYRDLMEASKNIPSRLEDWKIALYIADAINRHKKAFKCSWKQI